MYFSEHLFVSGPTYEFPDGLPMEVLSVLLLRISTWIILNSLLPLLLFFVLTLSSGPRIWSGNETELDQFFFFLNFLRLSIDFTLEVGGHSLSFLNLTIRLVHPHH